jgi:hypothetical protein
MSVHSACGQQRSVAAPSCSPYALLVVRIRAGVEPVECYAGSSVEAFVQDMRRRGLEVQMLDIPKAALQETAEEHHAHL